mmetsp:Transcript_33642/g.51888  ORF Transcript_33642/g.51888 Transcript_33642/m.51888 type:complete len:195 (+) Transcript_33642:2077-2661(+)|eukprot:CAMPEP_0170485450 /NCGR_PEP_ID=MMETSP0208-20121228/4726_1 /TAXON_ID=197538 /ORGANISM="Strombidium inclinatum, Strain S3" /LENGTH=194 /DNA_ID=CAMNT_0010759111 /DNA_START=2040 /DNA_END=2624 /DNA_ORIENTATION=+
MKAFFPKTYPPADGSKEEKKEDSSSLPPSSKQATSPLGNIGSQRAPMHVSNSQQQKNEKSLGDLGNLQKAGSAFPNPTVESIKKIDSKKTGAKYLSSTFDTSSDMQYSRGTVQKKNFFKTPTIQTEGSDYKYIGVNGLPTGKTTAATAGATVSSPGTRDDLKNRIPTNLIKSSASPYPSKAPREELQKKMWQRD